MGSQINSHSKGDLHDSLLVAGLTSARAKKVSKASKKSSTKKRRAPEKVECMGTLTPSKAAKRQKVEREAQRQGEELQQALAGIHGEEDESSLK
jgi:hypothetical protein